MAMGAEGGNVRRLQPGRIPAGAGGAAPAIRRRVLVPVNDNRPTLAWRLRRPSVVLGLGLAAAALAAAAWWWS